MRVAIVTPFVRTSSIGRNSLYLAQELTRRGHTVQIITSELTRPAAQALQSQAFAVRHWTEVDPSDLGGQFDVVFVNVGNYPPFHGSIFKFLGRTPSIGIFHDFYGYNLYGHWLTAVDARETAHDDQIVATYGPAARSAAVKARANRPDMGQIAAQIPMTEWIAAQCVAAVGHGAFYAPRLEEACIGPVVTAPLPWPSRDYGAVVRRKADRLVVSIIGHINRNKCADIVLQAIGSSRILREKVECRLVGAIEPNLKAELEALSARLKLSHVTFTGGVDDEAYVQEVVDADIICCLRRPVLEGASATCIEAMQAGKLALVSDDGFYAEVPDELVAKLASGFSADDVRRMLERWADDEAGRGQVGARARQWANARFTIEAYVDAIEPLMAKAVERGPAFRLLTGTARQLADLDCPSDHPTAADLAAQIAALTQANPQQVRRALTINCERQRAERAGSAPDWDLGINRPPSLAVRIQRFANRVHLWAPPWLAPALRPVWHAYKALRSRLRR